LRFLEFGSIIIEVSEKNIMKATELIEELEYAISINGNEDVEVRMAQQPKWAFEYSIESAVTIEVEDENTDDKEKIVYLSEGSQIGYLPELASSELGW
jgi:hypothetical protein